MRPGEGARSPRHHVSRSGTGLHQPSLERVTQDEHAPPTHLGVRSARFALPLAAVALALALPGTVAAAGDATGWSLLADADVRTIDERIAAGYRLTEIDTVSTSPERFAATFARDAGTGPAWWWYHDLRFEDIEAKLVEHGARLTRLEAYRAGEEIRYAALMVDNTGAAARTWWWWIGPPEEILRKVRELNARVIDLERHPDGFVTAVLAARGRKKSWTYFDRLRRRSTTCSRPTALARWISSRRPRASTTS